MKYLEGAESFENVNCFLSSKYKLTYYHKNKRLKNLNIKNKLKLKKYKTLQDTNIIPISYSSSGNNRYAFWFFKYLAEEKFTYNNKTQVIKYGEVKTKYTFVDTLYIDSLVCPNCGHTIMQNHGDVNFNCSFCGTFINDDVLRIRLNNFNLWMRDKTVRNGEKYIIAGLILMVISLGLLFPISLILIIVGLSKSSKTVENQKLTIEKQLLSNLENRKVLDIFKEDVINKVNQIHFVDSIAPIQYFVNKNIQEYIELYQNVVSSNVVNIFLTRVEDDGKYTYLSYELILVLGCKNDKIYKKYEKVLVTFARDKTLGFSSSKDSKVFCCKSCGANDIDYLDGGTCNYCKSNLNGIDNMLYDWVLMEYDNEFISYK